MTPERAANLLHLQIRFGFDTDYLKEAYRIGQAAIERCMVAKKPHKGSMLYICPNCDKFIEKREHTHGNNVIPHCKWCGQLIDWSDTECI